MSAVLQLLLGGSSDPTASGTNPETLTTLGTIATGGYSWRQAMIAGEAITYKSGLHRVVTAARNLRVAWGRGEGSVSRVYPDIRVGLEVHGIVYPVHWAGNRRLTTSPDMQHAISDPVPVQVEPGDTIYVRSAWPAGSQVGFYSASDLHTSGNAGGDLSGGGTLAHAGGSPVCPLGIYGDTDPTKDRGVLILGDSFIQQGWARGAVNAHGYAWSDLGVWLEVIPRDRAQLANRLPGSGAWPYRAALAFHSGNDSASPTETQQALHIAAWRMYRDAGVSRVFGITIHPYSTSTDRWTSVAGQTTRLPPDRNIHPFNVWVRDGAPLDPTTFTPVPVGGVGVRFGEPGHPAQGFFDCHAATAVDPHSASVWRVGDGTSTTGTAWTNDGAHLTGHGSDMLQQAFSAWLETNDLTT
ncbi:MAG: hypothetical protein Q4F65_06975 [Propionibacteriaceae bacterium]|nr:hypothetical protein [Propionibacteriaceae bacterium]